MCARITKDTKAKPAQGAYSCQGTDYGVPVVDKTANPAVRTQGWCGALHVLLVRTIVCSPDLMARDGGDGFILVGG